MFNQNSTNEKAASIDTTSLNTHNNYTESQQETQAKTDNLPFTDTEPWSDAVNGAELADRIHNTLRDYLFLPDGASEVLTMWILHTYKVEIFDYSPRLCIVSPEKRCGKTTLLRMVEHLSYHSLNVSNVTTAALFRIIDKWSPTMLIDEADTFLNENDELRGVINAGFQKDGQITRVETIGKKQDVKLFKCFAAIGIAAIKQLPGTIIDRGIVVSMRRKKRTDLTKRLRTSEFKPIAQQIRSQCLRFMQDNADKIAAIRPEIPERFNDRAADAWEPLFAIAEAISSEWRMRLGNAALMLTKSSGVDEDISLGDKLLSDIRDIFTETGQSWTASERLVEELKNIKESPWSEYNHRGLNANSLASLLRQYKIYPQQHREYGKRHRRYDLKDFIDAFERYLPPLESPSSGCASVPPTKIRDELADLPE